jgi:hypothetical protein
MPKGKCQSGFANAQKRNSERLPGEQETYCTICGVWDDCSERTWYRKHGEGKCNSQGTLMHDPGRYAMAGGAAQQQL